MPGYRRGSRLWTGTGAEALGGMPAARGIITCVEIPMPDQVVAAFFEDLARALDYWVDAVATTVESPQDSSRWMEDMAPYQRLSEALGGRTVELRLALEEGMRGLLLSALVIVDGGTASAEIGRVHLTDTEGHELAEGLHELFVDHLIETGRLE